MQYHSWSKSLFLLILTIILSGCGKNDNEETESKINEAYLLISQGNCEDALNLLTEDGEAYYDHNWSRAKASAEACLANYSTPNLVTNDISKLAAIAAADDFINATTTFTRTNMTGPTDREYLYLFSAMESLTRAGETTARSAAARSGVIGRVPSGDINFYLTFLTMNLMGRWYGYYGNVDAAGVKGAGGGANNCITDYAQDDAVAALNGGGGGNCPNAGRVSHPDVDAGNPIPLRARRLCEGAMIFNIFINAFGNITIPTGEPELTNLSGIIGPAVDAVCTGSSADLATLCTTYNINICLANHGAAAGSTAATDNFNTLEIYFGTLIEPIF